MKRSVSILALAVVTALTACERAPNKSSDTTLNTDLSLAAQQKGFQPFDSLGPAERAAGGAAVSGAPLATSPRPAVHRSASSGEVSRPSRTTSGGSRSTSGGTVQSSGGQV